MSVLDKKRLARCLDDSAPIHCNIVSTQTVEGHTEYVLGGSRTYGETGDETRSWEVSRRYTDFSNLHSILQASGIELPLPKKKMVGNLERDFIIERQKSLQSLIDAILEHPELSQSLHTKKFLDPTSYAVNFQELALQHVSMAFRSNTKYEVLKPLADIGARIRTHYFGVKDRADSKVEKILCWTDFGPDKYIDEKSLTSLTKSLIQMEHPFIQKIEHLEMTESGCLVVSRFSSQGSLRDLLSGSKPKAGYLKKYGRPNKPKTLELNDLRALGWQILQALNFLHEKLIPYGQLHTGNILLTSGSIQLVGVTGGIVGSAGRHRAAAVALKAASASLMALDVYSFGLVLYEMALGRPPSTHTVDVFPPECPDILKSVLESILSTEASKGRLPTVSELLSTPMFSLTDSLPSKPYLKISQATKEALKLGILAADTRLQNDYKAVKAKKKEDKMNAALEIDTSAKRKAARKKMKAEGTLENGVGDMSLEAKQNAK